MGSECVLGRGCAVSWYRYLVGALPNLSQSFPVIPSQSRAYQSFPAVSWSRGLESARVGKNLPARWEDDPQGGRSEVLFEGKEREETRKVRGEVFWVRS